MSLVLAVSLVVVGALVVIGLLGYLIDTGAERRESADE